ncbi:cytochrome c-type biogenesis protein [Idiomarina aquatica]|uniref:Cytochrome c-type biogenesis protein n=1 Tax=Idiomarina aquatica TaxID=1327752 RepID=A0AA94JDQ5_9GAMM|nr:cytochrome c-type biogenesis protein [Idiomarina aquatica]RUO45019.1 cystathionine gamma-synthase [Idiomarina aquatica]
MNRWLLCMGALLLSFSAALLAQQVTYDGHEFDNEQQRRTYEALIKELRCPKCQNQNIADSNAPLAEDMRERAYQMVMAGQSKQQVIDYMVARYGNFAHYKPPFNAFTAVLWLAPLVIALAGIIIALRLSRKRSQPVALSDEEQRELAQLKERSKHD